MMRRGTVDVLTLGVTWLLRRQCRICDHPMADHCDDRARPAKPPRLRTDDARFEEKPLPLRAVHTPPPAGPTCAPGWYPDPHDRAALCWNDGYCWYPESKRYPVLPGSPDAPAELPKAA